MKVFVNGIVSLNYVGAGGNLPACEGREIVRLGKIGPLYRFREQIRF